MTEPIRAPLSISRQALPAFFTALRSRTAFGPYPFLSVPDESIYLSEESPNFRLKIYTFSDAQIFSLVANFIGNGERLHLDWKLQTATSMKLVLIFGGLAILIILLLGYLAPTKKLTQWFDVLFVFIIGGGVYLQYLKWRGVARGTEKRYLDLIQVCIDDAERVTHATPRQSVPSPTETTP